MGKKEEKEAGSKKPEARRWNIESDLMYCLGSSRSGVV
jgi:hypothetical protein